MALSKLSKRVLHLFTCSYVHKTPSLPAPSPVVDLAVRPRKSTYVQLCRSGVFEIYLTGDTSEALKIEYKNERGSKQTGKVEFVL